MYYKINEGLNNVICEYDSQSVLLDILPNEIKVLNLIGCLSLSSGELIISDTFDLKTFNSGKGLECMRVYKLRKERDEKIKMILL